MYDMYSQDHIFSDLGKAHKFKFCSKKKVIGISNNLLIWNWLF